MKIEKISDNQIRCTLSREDLIDRELRISELAYGTEKAKALFRDMMQQANYEFGFDAEDIPLMIEAIPVSPECLVLVITKVEDPEELDTRFSKFSPDDTYDYEFDDNEDDEEDMDEEDVFHFQNETSDSKKNSSEEDKDSLLPLSAKTNTKKEDNTSKNKSTKASINIIKVYSFESLEEVIQMSKIVAAFYTGKNSLYKNPVNSIYYLLVSKSDHQSDEFNKISNMISEYGNSERSTYASPYYYEEHYELIIKDTAIQVLANL